MVAPCVIVWLQCFLVTSQSVFALGNYTHFALPILKTLCPILNVPNQNPVGVCRRTLGLALRDMGCTVTPLGHTSGRLESGLKPDFTIAQVVHESQLKRSNKPLVQDLSKVPRGRLRQTKSYTLPHKKRKTVAFRSHSVATNLSAEKGSKASLCLGGSPKRNRKPVSAFTGQCMRCKVHSARRCSSRRVHF